MPRLQNVCVRKSYGTTCLEAYPLVSTSVYLPDSQFLPVKFAVQLQVYEFLPKSSRHVPPCKHGLLRHFSSVMH